METTEITLEADSLDIDLIHYLEEKYMVEIWREGAKIYIKLSV